MARRPGGGAFFYLKTGFQSFPRVKKQTSGCFRSKKPGKFSKSASNWIRKGAFILVFHQKHGFLSIMGPLWQNFEEPGYFSKIFELFSMESIAL